MNLSNVIRRVAGASRRAPRAIIVVAVLLVWGRSLAFDFVWDDAFFVEQNHAIRALRQIPRMFVDIDAQAAYARGFMVFRPLRTVHYALLYAMGGGVARPCLFHAANLVWHAAAALLVHALALRLLRKGSHGADTGPRPAAIPALWAGLAFAVHPVVSEAVCWVKGLDDLMAAVFVLLATRVWLERPASHRWFAIAAGLYLAALYSKESAVAWPVLVAVVLWGVYRLPARRIIRQRLLPLGALTAAALLHRHLVLGRTGQTAPLSGTYGQTLVDMLTTVPVYGRLLLGIPPFRADYSYLEGGHGVWAPAVIAGAAVLLALLVATGWLLAHRQHRVAGLGCLWCGLFMLPVSNLVPMMQYMAERFLYLPLAGLAVAGAGVYRRLPARPVWRIAPFLLLLVWAGIGWQRAGIWRDDLSLFLATRQEAPPMRRVDHNLFSAVLGLPHMAGVYRIEPRPDGRPLISLASEVDRAQADWPRIRATLRELARLLPDYALALEAAGTGLAVSGRPDEGAALLERAVDLDPGLMQAWRNLVQALRDSGDVEAAREAERRGREFGVAF